MTIRAKVLLDSVNPNGDRLTTMEVTFPRFILAEFNTHRAFSRNSASSRAIPVQKQIEMMTEHPAMPVQFGTMQSGMQSGPPLEGEALLDAKYTWINAMYKAIESAQSLLDLNVHKEVTNRLLEPFMWHTVIVSATEWENFFGLRISELAQPEIHQLARLMREALRASTPKSLQWGEWHRPLLREDDYEELEDDELNKVSAARCGRVSYLTHDGVRSVDKDIELFDRLTSADPMHASPLEHVAQAVPGKVLGNFSGFKQLRHSIGERVTNLRPASMRIEGMKVDFLSAVFPDTPLIFVDTLPEVGIKGVLYITHHNGKVLGVYEV